MKKKALFPMLALVLVLALALAVPLAAPAGADPATGTMTVVSDTSTEVTSGNVYADPTSYPYPAVFAWEPGPAYPNDGPDDTSWQSNSLWDQQVASTHTFSAGADWIWESYRVVNPAAGDVVDFTKTFNIPGIPTAGTLYITCDNGYEVSLNGTLVGSAQLGAGWRGSDLTESYCTTSGWQSVENYNVFSLLQNGLNTLEIGCANEQLTNGTISSNPGGLIFEITITYETNLDVPVDIKPTSCPNPLNVKSKGVLPVAILGTADFDVTQVDLESVRLTYGEDGVKISPLRWALEDVATPFVPFTGKEDCLDCTTAGPDGYLDLTLKFDMQEVVAALGEVNDGDCLVLQLTGKLNDGTTEISGEDVVRILKKGKK